MALQTISRIGPSGVPASVLTCALLLAATGCRFSGAASYNLDELLDSDNSLRYMASQQSGTQWLLGNLVDSDWLSDDSILNPNKKPKPIPNPSKLVLKGATIRKFTFQGYHRVALDLHVLNNDERVWTLPKPISTVGVKMRWRPRGGGEPTPWQDRRLMLPLALAGGSMDDI